MKIKVNLKRIVAYTLILTTISTLPVYSAGDEDTNTKLIIEFNNLESLVKNDNRQLKIIENSISDLEDARDASRDALRQTSAIQEEISEASDGLNLIISNPLADNSTKELAASTQLSLSLSSNSLQNSSSITNGQMESSRLNLEQAEINLVNSSKKMFILLHQLSNNIEQMEDSHALMLNQLELTKVRSDLGLVTQSVVEDIASSLKELDASYSSLVHQLDSLLIQFKGILDISSSKEIELGQIPTVDIDYLTDINLEDDIDLAIKNSMSIKIKKQELSNNKASSKTRNNEIKLKENEIKLGITNQYNLLNETLDTLELSENKLKSLNGKLTKEQLRYDIGLISLMDLKSIINEVEAQKSTVISNSYNMFIEIENYEAMKNGMI